MARCISFDRDETEQVFTDQNAQVKLGDGRSIKLVWYPDQNQITSPESDRSLISLPSEITECGVLVRLFQRLREPPRQSPAQMRSFEDEPEQIPGERLCYFGRRRDAKFLVDEPIVETRHAMIYRHGQTTRRGCSIFNPMLVRLLMDSEFSSKGCATAT